MKLSRRLELIKAQGIAQFEADVRLALFNFQTIFDAQGRLLPFSEWPEDAPRAIAYIKSENIYRGRGKNRKIVGVRRTIRCQDKTEAAKRVLRWYTAGRKA